MLGQALRTKSLSCAIGLTGTIANRKKGYLTMLYFAKFRENNNEIIIFKIQEERDKWVNYQDEFSRDMGTTAENAVFQRMAISLEKAERIAGDAWDNQENYYPDKITGNLVLICPRRSCREVREDKRYQMILDLLEAANGAHYYDCIQNAASQMCRA